MDMSVTLGEGKKVSAEFKGFTIHTDQPVPAGGENSAPSPFDYFLFSLGTCAGFFVLSFCRERSIPTDDIRLEADFVRDQATHLVSKVSIRILLPKNFPDKYRVAVVKAAEQCTVKRHLDHPPQVEVSAV